MKFIFVFILLATLSIVNAIPHQLHKRVTTFLPCRTGVPPLSVIITPDPPVPGGTVRFIVFGQLSQPATTGSMIGTGIFDVNDRLIGEVFRVDYCSLSGCPSSNIYTSWQVQVPTTLPTRYSILVAFFSANMSVLGCAMASVGIPGPSSPASNLLSDDVTTTPVAGSLWSK